MRPVIVSLIAVLVANPALADGAAALDRFYAETRTLSGRFAQTVSDANGTASEHSEGEFAISRPGRFSWDYRQPYEQHIVADGAHLWIYEPDLDQVTVRPMDADTADAPGLLLAGARFPRELFEVVAQGNGWLRLTPLKKDSGLSEVRLKLGGVGIEELQLDDGLGQTTRIQLLDQQRNGALSAKRFQFTPPPGVDVIGALPQARLPPAE